MPALLMVQRSWFLQDMGHKNCTMQRNLQKINMGIKIWVEFMREMCYDILVLIWAEYARAP